MELVELALPPALPSRLRVSLPATAWLAPSRQGKAWARPAAEHKGSKFTTCCGIACPAHTRASSPGARLQTSPTPSPGCSPCGGQASSGAHNGALARFKLRLAPPGGTELGLTHQANWKSLF